jgi:hypothetical protein
LPTAKSENAIPFSFEYAKCEFAQQWRSGAHGKAITAGPVTQIKGRIPITEQKWSFGMAQVLQYTIAPTPKASQKDIIILSTKGVAPSYLLRNAAQTTYAYNIPIGQKACIMTIPGDYHPVDFQVYTRGTDPTA